MCHMVLMGLHKSVKFKEVQPIAKLHCRKLSPSGTNVIGLSRSSYIWYFTTRKACDCGTTIGCLKDVSSEVEYSDGKSYREKCKRKGWSDAKIARALYSMDKDAERHQQESIAYARSTYESEKGCADDWISFIHDAIDKSNHKSVYLMLDWGPEINIRLESEESVLLNEIDNNEVMYWQEKVAYRCNYK